MQTTSETNGLFDDLFERLAVLADLDGPQIEAWVSGLFPLFDETLTLATLIERCAATNSAVASLVSAALAELTTGLDESAASAALAAVRTEMLPPSAAEIGASDLAEAWHVRAPFGSSIVLGFTNRAQPERREPVPPELAPLEATEISEDDQDPVDLRHSILVEIGAQGTIEDLQLAGPPQALLAEAGAADDRVVVRQLAPADALTQIVAAWPHEGTDQLGPGFSSNQQFVRRRIVAASGNELPFVAAADRVIDVRRGLDDADYTAANRAALSTLRSAINIGEAATSTGELGTVEQAWVGVIRGDGGELSPRERDALLWLEWADWLGVGIGLLRAGAGSAADGATFVHHVNRCPEVSSSIDKRDRDYAEWAFEVALDLLIDVGAVQDEALTAAGFEALVPALVAAWRD